MKHFEGINYLQYDKDAEYRHYTYCKVDENPTGRLNYLLNY